MKRNPNIAISVLLALCATHLINDLLQSCVSASYPILKADLGLTFAQIGAISLIYQISASVFQPLVGIFFDRHPFSRSLVLATTFSMLGIIGMAFASDIYSVYASVFIVGLGSSIIHPEASRITSLASGGKRGFAQSIFQVGGNFGGAVGPLFIALIVAPYSRRHLLWFVLFSLLSYAVSFIITGWYRNFISGNPAKARSTVIKERPLSVTATVFVILTICILIISKYIFLESLRSYYTFYLIHKFGVSIQISQICLFVFLFSTAAGTLVGGPLGDKIGRKYVILLSILGTAPFSLALPSVSFVPTILVSFGAGFILSSAFPAILLYAQELLPNHLGMISGLFFGFAFGVGGIVSALLGNLIDNYGIELVYRVVSFSPLLGVIAILLPNLQSTH